MVKRLIKDQKAKLIPYFMVQPPLMNYKLRCFSFVNTSSDLIISNPKGKFMGFSTSVFPLYIVIVWSFSLKVAGIIKGLFQNRVGLLHLTTALQGLLHYSPHPIGLVPCHPSPIRDFYISHEPYLGRLQFMKTILGPLTAHPNHV